MDWNVIIVAALSLAGTLTGTYFSNRKASALIEYRLKQLEDKVNKHNSVVERTYELEKQVSIIKEDLHHAD